MFKKDLILGSFFHSREKIAKQWKKLNSIIKKRSINFSRNWLKISAAKNYRRLLQKRWKMIKNISHLNTTLKKKEKSEKRRRSSWNSRIIILQMMKGKVWCKKKTANNSQQMDLLKKTKKKRMMMKKMRMMKIILKLCIERIIKIIVITKTESLFLCHFRFRF